MNFCIANTLGLNRISGELDTLIAEVGQKITYNTNIYMHILYKVKVFTLPEEWSPCRNPLSGRSMVTMPSFRC
jgi:hypothetical protein